MSMSWSGFAKFLIGFFLAIAFVIAGSAAAAYYFFAKLTEAPPKPIFDNDSAELKAKAGLVSSPKPGAKPVAAKPATSPSPEPSPNNSASPSPDLPEGAYRAKVTWKDGLSLRESAGPEANRIGGLVYNQEIIVLRESPDGKWQYVRLAEGSQEGWIKAGNIEKVTEEGQAEASQTEETPVTNNSSAPSSPEPFTR